MIGGIIMTHGDDNGLVLPPRIAPTQAVVIPVAAHKPGVLEAAASLRDRLNAAGVRSKMDDSDNSPGWKFAEYELSLIHIWRSATTTITATPPGWRATGMPSPSRLPGA